MATYNGHNEDSSGNILLSIGNGMTATVETGTTASQAYTKGSYLFFNNRLCKATSAISSGATLAIGTNLSQTSIGQEITSHLRSSDGKEFYFDVKDGTYGYYPSASKTASEFVPFGGTSNYTIITPLKELIGDGTSTATQSLEKGRYLIIVTNQNWGNAPSYLTITLSYSGTSGSNYTIERQDNPTGSHLNCKVQLVNIVSTTTLTVSNYGYNYKSGALIIIKLE